MQNLQDMVPVIANLNALAGGLFIIAAFGIVATRQIRACMRFFILQSIFLAASAFLLGVSPVSTHLIAVGLINLFTKVWISPWLLKRLLRKEIYTRREITQAISIPASLIIAVLLTIGAYFFTLPWIHTTNNAGILHINVPIGLAGLFIGAYTLTIRREAIPQLLGLLAMENGAFFAGIAIAPNLPLIAELALAFDVLMLIFMAGVLTRTVHERTGTTAIGKMNNLREETVQ